MVGLAMAVGGWTAFPLALRAQGGGVDSAVRMPAPSPAVQGAGPPAAPPRPLVYDTRLSDTSLTYAAVMRLDDVVAATLRNSPDMAQASGAVRTGQSGERVAYGQFLPSLTLNSGAFQTSARSLTASPPTVTAGGGARW
jgi:outer membrane protein TolC